jgi:hypothetical protein
MRYFIGFLVTVGLIIILIILLFSGSGKPKVADTARSLNSYASTDAQVSITIDGPVNANSLHQQVRVIVDSNDVTFQSIAGYDGNVVNSQSFANTENAYNVFLHALTFAGFSKGDINPALRNETGYCSLGNRYIFELTQDGKNLQRYWATSCSGAKTYLGNVSLTLTLFQAQVPNYNELTSGISL